jgi:hypothetical protein
MEEGGLAAVEMAFPLGVERSAGVGASGVWNVGLGRRSSVSVWEQTAVGNGEKRLALISDMPYIFFNP